ncbi:class I mannose-6-phosphate isomerase [Plebeiibacterium sediminum]|uniref:Class I mannose-6-phosphate isomerase n=1 Tax=Plebeiibacterium sediminum TaxID=2992112 RepID=A0AAE3M2L6_9BACT|nr:class I mannose-6-phosphate isomerase [Plebeiobacterium sediminum]MCW3785984.1 class I mannose-6-phosphate isomerase [Plebeiobacterium sediminum]
MSIKSNFDKLPTINLEGEVVSGWAEIIQVLRNTKGNVIAIECYPGVDFLEFKHALENEGVFLDTHTLLKSYEEVLQLTKADVTDDAIFGFITRLDLIDFFDMKKLTNAQINLQSKTNDDPVIVCGPGAFLCVPNADVKIYADMARWEIQLRMRRNEVNGLGVKNCCEPFNLQYKRGFFVDWRVCDKFKKEWFFKCDYLLDTNKQNNPKLVKMDQVKLGLKKAVQQPFRLVPFFDPGPWGGHWMEEVCDLETEGKPNHAWCFDCVPEENSLLLGFNNEVVEIPSVDLVFFQSKELLGDEVEARFGQEFPIRFDFLDTMGGGNLSLQVHPDTTYIQQNFGMNYTQDESYYILDAKDNAEVYLGLKKDVDPVQMIHELNEAQKEDQGFNADKFVNTFPAKKHDHFLIPGGTIHCSGKDAMVLEISATPYIFTFKLWDWGRLGLDGKPRPINIKHASKVIDWSRDTYFAKNELVNQVTKLAEGDGWIEERTGLHKREFIETRRHWFTKPLHHNTDGGVNVLNLIEGREAIVESPVGSFEPFVVHYAETFIVPAGVGDYIIRPYGESEGKTIGTIKAFVRKNA